MPPYILRCIGACHPVLHVRVLMCAVLFSAPEYDVLYPACTSVRRPCTTCTRSTRGVSRFTWLRRRQRDGLDERAVGTLAEDALLIAADVGAVRGTLGLAVTELCIALQRCNNTNM